MFSSFQNAFAGALSPLLGKTQEQEVAVDVGGMEDKANRIRSLNRKRLQRQRLNECLIYIPFVILFHVYILTWRGLGTGFYATRPLYAVVLKDSFMFDAQVYENVVHVPAWWQWAQNSLVTQLWRDAQPNGAPVPVMQRRVLQGNRLIGAARLRQWRVRSDTCRNEMEPGFPCYGGYTHRTRDTEPFGPSGEYEWKSCSDMGGGTGWRGRMATFECDSYVLEFPFNMTQQEARSAFDKLLNDSWIDAGTRGVIFEFYTHSPDIDLVTSCKITLELTNAGAVLPGSLVRNFRVWVLHRWFDYLIMLVHAAFCLYLFIYIFAFLKAWKRMWWATGKKFKFLNGWNSLELVTYTICLVMVITRLMWMVHPQRLKFNNPDSHRYTGGYPVLDALADLWTWEVYVAACGTLVIFLRFFKYINPNPRLNLLPRTLRRSVQPLAGLALVVSIIFLGFVFMGYLVYGHTLYDFKSFDSATSVLLRIMIGDFDIYDTMREENRYFSAIYFSLFVALAFILLLNMILAVIVDSFQKEVHDNKGAASLYEQGRKLLVRIFRCNERKSTLELGMEEVIDKLVLYNKRFPEVKAFMLDDICQVFDFSTKQGMQLMGILDLDNSGAIEIEEVQELQRKYTMYSQMAESGTADEQEMLEPKQGAITSLIGKGIKIDADSDSEDEEHSHRGNNKRGSYDPPRIPGRSGKDLRRIDSDESLQEAVKTLQDSVTSLTKLVEKRFEMQQSLVNQLMQQLATQQKAAPVQSSGPVPQADSTRVRRQTVSFRDTADPEPEASKVAIPSLPTAMLPVRPSLKSIARATMASNKMVPPKGRRQRRGNTVTGTGGDLSLDVESHTSSVVRIPIHQPWTSSAPQFVEDAAPDTLDFGSPTLQREAAVGHVPPPQDAGQEPDSPVDFGSPTGFRLPDRTEILVKPNPTGTALAYRSNNPLSSTVATPSTTLDFSVPSNDYTPTTSFGRSHFGDDRQNTVVDFGMATDLPAFGAVPPGPLPTLWLDPGESLAAPLDFGASQDDPQTHRALQPGNFDSDSEEVDFGAAFNGRNANHTTAVDFGAADPYAMLDFSWPNTGHPRSQ